MFIAFEGPDNVGKSHSALALDCAGMPDYNVTKKMHEANRADWLGHKGDATRDPTPHTYDRVDWFSHMVYRLAYPQRDWNDDRPRTVFAMPDTHFVLKMHHPVMVDLIEDVDDGIGKGTLGSANEMYFYQFDFLMGLNRMRDYSLFRTMSIMEVANDPRDGSFSQKLVAFDSPTSGFTRDMLLHRLVDSDESLLAFLSDENHKID